VPKPDLSAAQIAALAALTPAADPIRSRLRSDIEIYCVGGAVRDTLLGQPCSDRDYVVVGARPQEMIDAGFTPVGSDFPVFLHPIDHNEYALARTERKQGSGYKGFVFSADVSVTLKEDLYRRDLTINAMATDALGQLIDPCHGFSDLQSKTLRHIGPAFSEDPVRLLRLARFAARWPAFAIAPETTALCRAIVDAGETKALVPERVWQEISKGLMESQPSQCLRLLDAVGAWPDLTQNAPAVQAMTMTLLDQMATSTADLAQRYAILIDNNGTPLGPPDLFKAPRACQELAQLLIRQSDGAVSVQSMLRDGPTDASAAVLLQWFTQGDALRKADRFLSLLQCFDIKGVFTKAESAQLASLIAHLQSEAAATAVAQAANQAQAAQQPIEQAVLNARVLQLKAHAFFQRPVR
jgi:tRNA nucleotidyltransferase (CCA-adding enzyme)